MPLKSPTDFGGQAAVEADLSVKRGAWFLGGELETGWNTTVESKFEGSGPLTPVLSIGLVAWRGECYVAGR
ncbi:hypothetical protein PF001_g29026 [Phytophthora fragariae]|uniref:Uncharacterized protein n=1 Tax=Phytophthora fragariae TaxID=53985 RepID=A0A6A4B917_9STRA|nr:hypothetical protein PF001_g29026 [Phytophthora fragariae]